MKTIQWSKSLRSLMILILILGSNSCTLGFEVGVEKQTRQVLEDAIDELGNWRCPAMKVCSKFK